MQAVIIHPNIAVAKAYRSLLKSSLGIDSSLAFTSQEARDLIQTYNCQLVILNFPFNQESSLVYQETLNSQKDCKALIIPEKEDYEKSILDIRESDKCMILPQKSGSKYFCETVKTLHGINISQDLLRREFMPVKIEELIQAKEYGYDYFIKLSEEKFTRLIRAFDPSAPEVIDKYLQKGCSELYMGREDYFSYLDKSLQGIQQKVELFQPQFKKAETLFSSQEMQVVSHVLSNLNISPLVLEKANKVLQDSVSTILKESKLFQVLKNLHGNDNYIGGHSLMLAYLSSAMAHEMEWEDKEISKLTTASLLHDIGLTRTSLVKLHHENFDDVTGFTPEDFTDYRNHPSIAAEQVATMAGLSPDIEKIIQQHHERQDGEGFPQGLKFSQITPQACLFIVAEEFVSHIYHGNLSTDHLNQIKMMLGERYSKGNFRAAYVALCKIISNNQNLRYQAA